MSDAWKPDLSNHEGPLYLAIADALAGAVEAGHLAAGTVLPTQRDLADRLKVALGTVTRAYAEAERRGLVHGEGRRGTVVGHAPSSRAVLSSMARRPAGAIDMSMNHPCHALDPHLAGALRAIARDARAQQLLQYVPAGGLPRHREAGARWLNSLGVASEPEEVFVTPGGQHALTAVLAAEVQPGETIAAEQLAYPGIRAAAEQFGLQVEAIPMDEVGIIPDALAALCRRRKVRLLYCNPSLQNPTTAVCPMDRKQEIAKVAQKYGVTVLEDEVMRPLLGKDTGFIGNLIPDLSYLVVSASKAVAAGLRVGFVKAPAKGRQRLNDSIAASCLGGPPLTVEIFARWLEDGTVERTTARRQKDTALRQKTAARILKDASFRGHPHCFHVWLMLPEHWSGLRLAMAAQQRGVSVTPAEAFAVDRRTSVRAVRVTVVAVPDVESLERGLGILVELLGGTSGDSLVRV